MVNLDATFNSAEAYIRMIERVENYAKDPDSIIDGWKSYLEGLDLSYDKPGKKLVTLYSSKGYEKVIAEFDSVGEYNLNQGLNDKTWSMSVEPDVELWLYQDKYCAGRQVLVRGNCENIYEEYNMKKKLSSIKIIRKRGDGTPVVNLYNKFDFNAKGGNITSLKVGTYTKADLLKFGQKIDTMSSLQIDPRLKVTLYDGPDFDGESITLKGDVPNLREYKFNDRTASMVVGYDQ